MHGKPFAFGVLTVSTLLLLAGCNIADLGSETGGGAASFDIKAASVTQTENQLLPSAGTETLTLQGGSSAAPATPSNAAIGEVKITYDHVQIQNDSEEWITLSDTQKSETLSAVDSVNDLVALTDLPPGRYTQIRLSIVRAQAMVNGFPTAVRVPSSALKLVANFEIEPAYRTELTLLFDAQKSVVVSGYSGRVLLSPVVRVETAMVPME